MVLSLWNWQGYYIFFIPHYIYTLLICVCMFLEWVGRHSNMMHLLKFIFITVILLIDMHGNILKSNSSFQNVNLVIGKLPTEERKMKCEQKNKDKNWVTIFIKHCGLICTFTP